MRFTGVSNRGISYFNKIKTLKHIYLEKPDTVEDDDESITDDYIMSLNERSWSSGGVNALFEAAGMRSRVYRGIGSVSSPADHVIETLVLRNYPGITDHTLMYTEKFFRALKYLDVTGTSCSADQASISRNKRPEVHLIL